MNKNWSDKNKQFQLNINKQIKFFDGIKVLLELRNELFAELISLKIILSYDDFSKIPLINQDGYHSKTFLIVFGIFSE